MIGNLLLLAALQIPQQPAPPGPETSPQSLDLVVLRNGEEITGRLTQNTPKYIEILIDDGTLVGFPRRQTAKVVPGGGGPVAQQAARATQSGSSHQWFALHDGTGSQVGWLHSYETVLDDGALEIGEEWEFHSGTERTGLTVLERLDPSDLPVSCYYRERTYRRQKTAVGGRDQVAKERIVEAIVRDGVLSVRRLGTEIESGVRTYRMPEGASFPLAARRALAGIENLVPERTVVTVFDPQREAFTVLSFHPTRYRRIAVDGGERTVKELVSESIGSTNSMWLGPTGEVVRREINGPALVAVATSEAAARAAGAGGRVAAALRREPDGRFGLWLPNPTWSFDDEPIPGQIVARCATHGARVHLVLLDHLDRGTTLESAADAVERWQTLLHTGVRIAERRDERVRGQPAVCLVGTRRDGQKVFRYAVYVVAHSDGFLTLVFECPEGEQDRMRGDLERIVDTLELEKPVEPQGPLAGKV